MLTLTGTVRAVVQLGGGIMKSTGEAIPVRHVVQIEGFDNRGLVALYTLTVPDPAKYVGQEGKQISLPVRAWAKGAMVNLAYEEAA